MKFIHSLIKGTGEELKAKDEELDKRIRKMETFHARIDERGIAIQSDLKDIKDTLKNHG